MIGRALSSLILGCTVALAACSSSDGGGGSPQGVIPTAFTTYCTGTLKTDQKLMQSNGAGAWMGNGSMHASAGTPFLVSPDFGQWQGYVLAADGSATKIDLPFGKGLVKDTDFTSDCATDAALSDSFHQKTVILAASHVYASKDLSGDACTLDAGTAMTNYSFMSGGLGGGSSSDPALVGSDEIKAKCGYATGYTKDMVYATLVPTSSK